MINPYEILRDDYGMIRARMLCCGTLSRKVDPNRHGERYAVTITRYFVIDHVCKRS